MEKMNLRINLLPAFTYNWLHMNAAVVKGAYADQEQDYHKEVPEGVRESISGTPVLEDVRTGGGTDVDRLVRDSGISTHVFTVPEGIKVSDEALRLSFDYENGAAGRLNAVALELEPDSELTVVMDYHSDAAAGGLAGVQTKISAGKNSLLRLVQVQRLGSGFTFLNDVGGVCAENARIEVIHVILSGGTTYQGCRTALSGDGSTFGADIGYQVEKTGHLDMNYDSYHTGKQTSCQISASGVLRDEAFKLFRGTIDFQTGCSGSTGDEMEDVLLMDEGVVNQTIPLILCAEEDVVGNHGATIGRLDEGLMFYLETRGMNRDQIYEMMAKARIDAVIRKIPDQKTKELLLGKEEADD